jgi:hypothetical protein
VDVVAFGHALGDLTIDDVRAIAEDLAQANSSPADDIATTRSVLVIEQSLRRTHRVSNAAAAALVAATAVQDVAVRAHIQMPDPGVTRVARAAAQLARGLVVCDSPGVDNAVRCLGRGWHRLPSADFASV